MELLEKGIEVLSILEAKGFEAYVVGGAVRDIALGLKPKDVDICSNALPEEVMDIFKSFPSGIAFGTVTIFFKEEEFEVTTFRKDGGYVDGRRPEGVLFTNSLEDDLSRRDLTINSLAMNNKKELIDIFGGLSDLKSGVIRTVGNPSERFQEDALRILRTFRFSARFNFEIDEDTILGIVENKWKLALVSNERIRDELIKILQSDNVNKVMHQMYDLGIFDVILKELNTLFGVEQNHPNHIFNLATHTFKSIEALEDKRENLLLTMLLHDIGKVETKVERNGKDTFYKHNVVSVHIADEMLKDLRVSNRDRLEILELIRMHDREMKLTEKAVRRLVNQLENTNLDLLIAIKKADILAQNPELKNRINDMDKVLSLSKAVDKITLKDLALNGNDLMEKGFKGKEIGEKLDELLDIIIDNPKKNKKDILISFL